MIIKMNNVTNKRIMKTKYVYFYHLMTKVHNLLTVLITISVIRGSSGLGSAIKSWMLVSTVDTFKHGFQAP